MPSKAEIEARMDLNNKGFKSKIKQSRAELTKFGKSVTKAANRLAKMGLAAAAGAFALLSRSAIAYGSAQSDISNQLDIDTVKFQTYAGAIKDAGGTQEQMRKSIVSQTQAIVQGSEGLTTFTRAFERLGLNVHDLRKLKPEEQFEEIAKAVANAKDQQGAFTAVSEIYGKRNAPELIEVMRRLSKDGFQQLSKDIRETYGIMDAETQASLDKAADAIEQFKQRATIKVGELIAGEADGAAVKVLTAKLMGAVAKFSVGLLETIYKLAGTVPVAIGGVFEGVANKFGFSIVGVALKFKLGMENAANSVIEKFNELTGANVARLYGASRELLEFQQKGFEKNAGIMETATERVLDLWNDEPLKGWKDDIDEGTAAISEAYEADLEASRKAGAERRKAAKDAADLLRQANGGGTDQPGVSSGSRTGHPDSTTDSSEPFDDGTRGNIRTGKITTGKIGGFRSRFGPAPTMRERERAAGLYNSTLGRDGRALDGLSPAPSARQQAADQAAASAGRAGESAPATEATLAEIRRTLAKLDQALS